MVPAGQLPARVPLVDALRGAAVLGILVDNIQEFAMPHAGFFFPISYGNTTGWNYAAWHVSNSIFCGRFFAILMMVFGAGIVLGEDRAGHRGMQHLRRMTVLAVIGLLHAWFLWDGDILFVMGLAGLLVYLPRRWSARRLTSLALVLGLAGPLVMVVSGAADARRPLTEAANFSPTWEPDAEMTHSQIAQQRGSWREQQSLRVRRATEMYAFVIPVYLFWRVASYALIGMALLKCGLLTGVRRPGFYGGVLIAALTVGLTLSVTAVQDRLVPDLPPPAQFTIALAYEFVTVTTMAVGWISLLVLVGRTKWSRQIIGSLAKVGRMSLSNYLAQTVICTALFYGLGLGLFGRVERMGQLGIVATIWLVQIAVSSWWLSRFRFGPFEWLWRVLVYGGPALQGGFTRKD